MSACPVRGGEPVGPDPLDARNAMPADLGARQLPSPGQRAPLSRERQTSSIPRADDEEAAWQYPSPQMFYNAMKRKGWRPAERDMDMVVAIHNAVNERAWAEVLRWEAAASPDCRPRLAAIRGLGERRSPKARLWTLLGGAAPFDRHDWQVDRCGTPVRYVIDYYDDDPTPGKAAGVYLDVRPALDGPAAAWARAGRGPSAQLGSPKTL